MPLILPTRNSLAYPVGVATGYDPAHIANRGQNSVVSFVARQNNCQNVLNGLIGAIGGTPSAGINGYLGPCVSFPGGTDKVTLAISTSQFKSATMAAIVFLGNLTSYRNILSSSSASNGWRFYTTGNLLSIVAAGVLELTSGLVMSTNVPYFVAASVDVSVANFVVGNLLNGSIRTASVVSTTATAGNGVFQIGNDLAGDNLNGAIACGMMNGSTATASRLSLAELTAWASDPWSFWYPRRAQSTIKAASAAAFPYWVANNTGVLGAGVY